VIVPNLSRGVRPYAITENVGTLATHRRQGLGSLVMRAIIAHCWEAGCYKTMLASGVQRGGAHAFYAALGFDARAKQSFMSSGRCCNFGDVGPCTCKLEALVAVRVCCAFVFVRGPG
jgi:hypothetical protein